MIREVKTFRVSCDWCDNSVIVNVSCDEPSRRDAAIEAGDQGWRHRWYADIEWDGFDVLCPNHNEDDDVTIGSGWRTR